MTGTTPTLTIGDAGAEDTAIVFDGNAQDFYIALDDSADDLLIGLGSTIGTTPALAIDENFSSANSEWAKDFSFTEISFALRILPFLQTNVGKQYPVTTFATTIEL